MLGNQTTNALGTYDFTQMDLVQLNKPSEGQDVAVIETNLGTITAVLYAEFAPKTVANFKKRAEEGFYDGKPFFALQKGIYAITGASNDEGTEGVTDDGKFIENECSVNLWPFKGALLGYSSQQGYSDSRFFFTGALEITEENKKELRGYTDQETSAQVIPDELITAFEKRGSVPGFAGTYTVFGQVINGFDMLCRNHIDYHLRRRKIYRKRQSCAVRGMESCGAENDGRAAGQAKRTGGSAGCEGAEPVQRCRCRTERGSNLCTEAFYGRFTVTLDGNRQCG